LTGLNIKLVIEMRVNQKGKEQMKILKAKETKALDTKSIAHYAKILDIKGNTNSLKKGMSTL